MRDKNNAEKHRANSKCAKCERGFAIKVRDHDHLTGRYRGALCRGCNLQRRETFEIPVYVHNLQGFDSHLIIQSHKEKISVLSRNQEQIITMSIGNFKVCIVFLFVY